MNRVKTTSAKKGPSPGMSLNLQLVSQSGQLLTSLDEIITGQAKTVTAKQPPSLQKSSSFRKQEGFEALNRRL